MKGTWQTTDGGGGGEVVLALLAVLAIAAIAGPVMAAVAEPVHVLLVIAVVVIGVGVADLVALLAWRWRHRRPAAARAIAVPPRVVRAAQPLPEPQRRAIERPQEVHVHHHWHGVDAEDVAEILRGSCRKPRARLARPNYTRGIRGPGNGGNAWGRARGPARPQATPRGS